MRNNVESGQRSYRGEKPELRLPFHMSDNPASLPTLYRRLFALRRERSTLVTGRLEIVAVQRPLLAYQIMGNEEKYMILLNFSSEPQI